MKRTYISLLAAPLLLISCNDIAEDDRLIATEGVAVERAVLIEDFTGQDCVNCPAAHNVIEKLLAQYGDAVIPVSIHAGDFGISVDNKRYTGLMTPEGDVYNDAWNIDEWPKGVVNRSSAGAVNPDEWADAVRKAVEQTSPLDIELTAESDGATIDIQVTLEPKSDVNGYLQVWILEDGIVARQRDLNQGLIKDYVHNHVYRASVNGIGGEAVSLKGMIHKDFTYSMEVRNTETEKWVADNLSVVAFVYNDGGVSQATKTNVLIQK